MSTPAFNPTPRSISVIIAAYNEAETLEPVLQRTLGVLQQIARKYEVIIVDDGSHDATRDIANTLAAESERVRVIHHGQNRGFGAALITGYANARHNWVAPLPADGQIPPEELTRFVPVMAGADMVIGLRPQRPYSSYRKLLHKGMTWLTMLLFGRHHPPSAGSCMFRREVFQSVRLLSTSGFANTEFPIKVAKQGYRLATVPIKTEPRLSGQSKVANARTIYTTIWDMIKARWSLRL